MNNSVFCTRLGWCSVNTFTVWPRHYANEEKTEEWLAAHSAITVFSALNIWNPRQNNWASCYNSSSVTHLEKAWVKFVPAILVLACPSAKDWFYKLNILKLGCSVGFCLFMIEVYFTTCVVYSWCERWIYLLTDAEKLYGWMFEETNCRCKQPHPELEPGWTLPQKFTGMICQLTGEAGGICSVPVAFGDDGCFLQFLQDKGGFKITMWFSQNMLL